MPIRIAVVGTTCSGKTTVAKRLAAIHGVPHVELDALHWGPDWSEPSVDEFRARVEESLAVEGWVADGGYHGKLDDLVVERAELVVWLDPPLPTVLRRRGARTVRRAKRRGAVGRQPRDLARRVLQPRLAVPVGAQDAPAPA